MIRFKFMAGSYHSILHKTSVAAKKFSSFVALLGSKTGNFYTNTGYLMTKVGQCRHGLCGDAKARSSGRSCFDRQAAIYIIDTTYDFVFR